MKARDAAGEPDSIPTAGLSNLVSTAGPATGSMTPLGSNSASQCQKKSSCHTCGYFSSYKVMLNKDGSVRKCIVES